MLYRAVVSLAVGVFAAAPLAFGQGAKCAACTPGGDPVGNWTPPKEFIPDTLSSEDGRLVVAFDQGRSKGDGKAISLSFDKAHVGYRSHVDFLARSEYDQLPCCPCRQSHRYWRHGFTAKLEGHSVVFSPRKEVWKNAETFEVRIDGKTGAVVRTPTVDLSGVWELALPSGASYRLELIPGGVFGFQHLGKKLPVSRSAGTWKVVGSELRLSCAGTEPDEMSFPLFGELEFTFKAEATLCFPRMKPGAWTWVKEPYGTGDGAAKRRASGESGWKAWFERQKKRD